MKTVTLPDFLALNEQLAALAAAGVPLVDDLAPPGGDARQALLKLNASVTQRMAEGLTLQQALHVEPQLPASYRSMLQAALYSDDRAAALVSLQRLAQSRERLGYSLQSALVYPLILLGLAYVGLILFCRFLVPPLERLYADMHLPPGSGLRVLQALRWSLPYWVAVPPLALVIAVLVGRGKWQARGRSSSFACLPEMSQAAFERESSQFADTFAHLLAAGMSTDDALPIAAGVWRDAGLNRDAQSLAPGSAFVARLPPFLRWALLESEPTMPREEALRLAAKVYYESAERRSARLRIFVPLAVTVLFGGTVTLLYGLTLFVPVAQLLRATAS